jgi:CRISPR-associated protein Csh2
MLAKRAEILFYYDARMSNPNGDPDENRPRIDKVTKKNYVTDFRLKRTIRDYMLNVLEKKIFMRPELVSPNRQDLKTIEDLAFDYIDTKNKKINRRNLLNDHIDIKLFGLLFAVGDYHFHQIGPVQFSIGQSLNKVEEMPIRMTRVVPTREEAKGGGFGEKYIVRYSFIGFHGFVNDFGAKDTMLSEEDIKIMLKAMWRGTTILSTSSKFGQQSRLLLKVNYKNEGYIGDLDLKPKLEIKAKEDPLENVSQLVLNLTDLFDTFSDNSDIIESIEYEFSPELLCSFNEIEKPLDDIIKISKIKGFSKLNL